MADTASSTDKHEAVTPAEFAALPDVRALLSEPAVAVAVSGGPDSMALCWLLSRLKDAPAVHALTVDHGLRPAAAAEARQVARVLKGWPKMRHEILTLKKNRGADARRVMERARQGRYAALAAYCREHNISVLLTAHHLDDQAETFLFRLAKGSGPDGLAGMRARQAYDARLTIARPLLEMPKARLVATCRAQGIPFTEDPTNADAAFARSRLRQAQDVLAREGLTAKRLGVTALRLRRACDALDQIADAALAGALREQAKGGAALDFAALAAQPAEIRLRTLLKVMTTLKRGGGEAEGYGPRRDRLEALAADLFAPDPFRKRTLGGFIFALDRRKGLIRVQREEPA